jgi:Mg2+ and Co2+ transporter CorA
MDELARAATIEVLPKATSHASVAYDPAAVHAKRAKAMPTALKYLTTLVVIAVFLVLLAGLWNMMRGTSPNLSQKLMRWRVGLQFLAIMIAMILVYLLRS